VTQHRKSQSIGLLVTVVFSAVLLWALAAMVWPAPVVYANEPPTDISLSNSSVAENEPISTTVGTFSTTDPDPGDSHTYSFAIGLGDDDNDSFTIVSDTLKTAETFDYETKNTYNIRAQSDDGNGGTYTKPFTITVTDVNDPPVANDDPYSVNEGDVLTVTAPAGVLANDIDDVIGLLDLRDCCLVESAGHRPFTIYYFLFTILYALSRTC